MQGANSFERGPLDRSCRIGQKLQELPVALLEGCKIRSRQPSSFVLRFIIFFWGG